jgi:glycosyltransferase involved in cell wall biosynthesis
MDFYPMPDSNNLDQENLVVRVAVILPCYNEAAAIATVIEEFRTGLPNAEIYVFDNNSSDDTAEVARASGARVTHVRLRGKGNVIRRMFADVDADIYFMVDGDATYDVSEAQRLVERLQQEQLDMLVGCRMDDGVNRENYRPGHRWGNRLLTNFVGALFDSRFSDMLSGYRIFSRRFVKSFPARSWGFEIETELTIHALELRMPVAEHPVTYRSRLEGSTSKLSTYRDGWRILKTILKLFINERPLQFFSAVGILFALVSLALVAPLLVTYLQTGLVPRLPTAVLSTGMMISAMLSLVCGVILNTVTISRHEIRHLAYLAVPRLAVPYHSMTRRSTPRHSASSTHTAGQ